MTKYYLALFVAISANVFANLAFKQAMQNTAFTSGKHIIIELLTNHWIWAGLLTSAVLLCSYLYAIRGIEISVAYASVTGIAMIGIVLFGTLLFSETLTLFKIFGIGLVSFGIFLIMN